MNLVAALAFKCPYCLLVLSIISKGINFFSSTFLMTKTESEKRSSELLTATICIQNQIYIIRTVMPPRKLAIESGIIRLGGSSPEAQRRSYTIRRMGCSRVRCNTLALPIAQIACTMTIDLTVRAQLFFMSTGCIQWFSLYDTHSRKPESSGTPLALHVNSERHLRRWPAPSSAACRGCPPAHQRSARSEQPYNSSMNATDRLIICRQQNLARSEACATTHNQPRGIARGFLKERDTYRSATSLCIMVGNINKSVRSAISM